jgi:uncharacterized membrane protein
MKLHLILLALLFSLSSGESMAELTGHLTEVQCTCDEYDDLKICLSANVADEVGNGGKRALDTGWCSTCSGSYPKGHFCYQPSTERTEDDVEDLELSAEEDYAAADNDATKGHVDISAELELPFPMQVAFDAFSDLPRQPSWSPWLHSVSYVDPPGIENRETTWQLRYLGLRLSWNARNTRVERPYLIQWQSTSGMKNFGRVEFSPSKENAAFTLMKMTLTLVIPGPAGRMFQKSERIKGIVKERMLEPTLINFSTIVMENDMKPKTGTPEPASFSGPYL